MQFDSLAEFFAMGGHGLYVWLAYGATVALLLLNFTSARQSFHKALHTLSWQAAVRDRQKQSPNQSGEEA